MFTEYSLFWLFPILLSAAAITYFAYFFNQNTAYSARQRNTLAVFRFLSLSLILFLLLSPVVKTSLHRSEKPIVVIAQDNSSSLILTKDSLYHRSDYTNELLKFGEKLKKHFDVRIRKFASQSEEIDTEKEKRPFRFDGVQTDIAECLEEIRDEHSGQNLSAIVLATDGISTTGANPLNVCERLNIPIFTVALGDTTLRRDLAVNNVRCNKIAYMDDEFPIEITIKALKADGQSTTLQLFHDGKILFSKPVSINGDKYSLTVPFKTSCSKAGVHKFTVKLAECENEANRANNVREFFVEILDSRRNIVLLAAVPHPDVSAIKQSISKNKNYNVESQLFSRRNELTSTQIDLLIAHQLPFSAKSYDYLKALQAKGVPILYILGAKTDFSLFNRLDAGLVVTPYNKSSQAQSQALYNTNFTLFSLGKAACDIFGDMPPLNTPLARFNTSPATQALAYQYVNGVKTDYPLLCFHNNAQQKSGIICGENIWKWRLQNMLLNQSCDEADEIMAKSIQYLVSSADKSLFRVKHDNIFNRGNDVTFEAELYNQSYQLINTPEVQITIRNEKGMEYKHTFSKTNNAYFLNAGTLASGSYTYLAQTTLSGVSHKATGSFVVAETEAEAVNLVADHGMLNTLSRKTGAKMLYASQLETLEQLLLQNDTIKPVIHTEVHNQKLIESFWYWIAIVLCLGGEWFLRKYWGRI